MLHAVCYSYSKVLEQKEELEQKHLHLLQILDSERQAKWHYVQQTEELAAEVKKLKEEVRGVVSRVGGRGGREGEGGRELLVPISSCTLLLYKREGVGVGERARERGQETEGGGERSSGQGAGGGRGGGGAGSFYSS